MSVVVVGNSELHKLGRNSKDEHFGRFLGSKVFSEQTFFSSVATFIPNIIKNGRLLPLIKN